MANCTLWYNDVHCRNSKVFHSLHLQVMSDALDRIINVAARIPEAFLWFIHSTADILEWSPLRLASQRSGRTIWQKAFVFSPSPSPTKLFQILILLPLLHTNNSQKWEGGGRLNIFVVVENDLDVWFETVIKINDLDQWCVLPRTITGRVFSLFERADVDSEVHLSRFSAPTILLATWLGALDRSLSPSSSLLQDITAEERCRWHLLMNWMQ